MPRPHETRRPSRITTVPRHGLVALALAVSGASAVAQTPDSARITAIERGLVPTLRIEGRLAEGPFTLAERMEHYRVPGVSIAVVDGGRVAWAKGYGVEEAGTDRRVTAETLFQAASISKPVAALGALMLVRDTELGLDDDVNDHLRRWRVPDSEAANGRPVTLRQLLTHTAGLTVHGFGGYASDRPIPDVLEVLAGTGAANSPAVVVDLEPGTRYRYSGGGYTVAQLLIEEVSGRPFADYMRDRVLERIGMRMSTYEQPIPLGLRPQAATGHDSGGRPIPGRYHTYPEMAAAGLWTTPADLARWVVAVQAGRAGRPGALLPRALVDSMLTAGVGGHGLGPGLAGEDDALRFQHGGSNAGFKAFVMGFADRGQGVAIMTNGDGGSLLAQEIVLAVADAYDWPAPEPETITPLPLAEADLVPYAGRYAPAGPRSFVVEVYLEGGRLFTRVPGEEPTELVAVRADTFRSVDTGRLIVFQRDADDRVTAITSPIHLTRIDP